MISQKTKGPAETAISPSRDSHPEFPEGNSMNAHSDITSAASPASQDAVDIIMDVETMIIRAKDLAQLIFMAGEGILDRKDKNAITAGCDVIDGVLKGALDKLAEVRGRVE